MAAEAKKSKDLGKTTCQACKKKCSGEVLRVQEKYFHISCFKCKVCNSSLAQGGFFSKDADYFCVADYQRLFGTRCAACGDFVEGEVVTALGNTYHQKCFTCARCRQPFPAGERVTFTGQECLCSKCLQIPIIDAQSPTQPASPTSIATGAKCSGCSEELKEGQALIALDKQWHIWCFKCTSCSALLHGEYMGKDGLPYCEKDYQRQFGVKCAYCQRYIAGKVLQAGENHHFHPTCARCSKCGDPFGDGEEMYVQGTAIWHPRCGPGPTANGSLLNGSAHEKEHKEFDRMSSSAASETQFSLRSHTPSINGSPSPYNSLHRKYSSGNRTLSPGLILRDYPGKASPFEDISRIYTYSYLAAEPTQGYLKKPIDPYDKPPKSPHFHRPVSAPTPGRRVNTLPFNWRSSTKPGMKALLDSIERETPRPRSPHMNNEEPIELAHYPNAGKPKPEEKPRIERDDFPAPPYPYTDPERRRRWSETYRAVSGSDGEGDEEADRDRVDRANDPKLAKEEKELSKIATGIGKVFLQNVKEREKFRQWKAANVDPRNASRTPSANKEPPLKLRYGCAVNASPSRVLDHPKPFEEDDLVDQSSSFRSSMGRSVGTIPSYNVVPHSRNTPRPGYTLPMKACTLPNEMRHVPPDYNSRDLEISWLQDPPVVSSLRYVPKPGYGLAPTPRSHTFTGPPGDYSFSGLGDKTHSTEFGSKQSDISVTSLSEVDRRGTDLRSSATYSSNLGSGRRSGYPVTGSGIPSSTIPFQSHHHLRRSLPNMSHSMYQIHLAHTSTEPPKIYPAHLLSTGNYRLPADVDRCHLERHLSDADFEDMFHMTRTEFYRLPEWRRNDIKKRTKLF